MSSKPKKMTKKKPLSTLIVVEEQDLNEVVPLPPAPTQEPQQSVEKDDAIYKDALSTEDWMSAQQIAQVFEAQPKQQKLEYLLEGANL